MKKIFLVLGIAAHVAVYAQKADAFINSNEVKRIEQVLASDDFQGRKAGTPGIDKAAQFISEEFKKAGLQPVSGGSYLQSFSMLRPKFKGVKGEMDKVELDPKNVIVITTKPELKVNEKDGYRLEYIKTGENFRSKVQG